VGTRYWDQSWVQQQQQQQQQACNNNIINSNNSVNGNRMASNNQELILATGTLAGYDSYYQTFSGNLQDANIFADL